MKNTTSQKIKQKLKSTFRCFRKNPTCEKFFICDYKVDKFIIDRLKNIGKKIDIILMEYHFKSPKIIENALTKNHFVVFYKNGYNQKISVNMLYAVNNSGGM